MAKKKPGTAAARLAEEIAQSDVATDAILDTVDELLARGLDPLPVVVSLVSTAAVLHRRVVRRDTTEPSFAELVTLLLDRVDAGVGTAIGDA